METKEGPGKDRWGAGERRLVIVLVVLAGVIAAFLARALLPEFGTPEPSTLLQWLLALLPGAIIVSQLVYLWSSRRNQYREALGPMEEGEVKRLADLYFGLAPLAFRYVVPAIFVTVLCGTIISALVDPYPFLPWLYGAPASRGAESRADAPPASGSGVPPANKGAAAAGTLNAPPGASGPQGATSTPPGQTGGAGPADAAKGGNPPNPPEKPEPRSANTTPVGPSGSTGAIDTAKGGSQPNPSGQEGAQRTNPAPPGPAGGSGPTDAAKTATPTNAFINGEFWPEKGPKRDVLRGAALGFLGAYVYLLLLLTDRARQRDITTGIATWAAAMPVLGLLMGGVAALIVASALGATDTSWTRDAIFFVAGMLPRQFAGFVQSGVVKMFQQGSSPVFRTLPLTTLRGVGPDVASRLEEEGIHDVSALAYASPHQLIRTTTYSPRQIVDWIDEALLVATVPEHWTALEKAGVTGALDLAWYSDHADSIPALATEIKLDASLLTGIVTRLSQDAQVEDLRQLYWDKTESLAYRFFANLSLESRAAVTGEIKAIMGVRAVRVEGDKLTVEIDRSQREAIDKQLRGKAGIEPQN